MSKNMSKKYLVTKKCGGVALEKKKCGGVTKKRTAKKECGGKTKKCWL